jgi:O-antigen ligase
MGKIKLLKLDVQSAFYILLLAGYIVISGLPYLLSVSNRTITVSFRAFVLGISLLLIFKKLLECKKISWFNINSYYIVFWLLYLVNVYLSFSNYEFTEYFKSREYEIYVRIVGVCMLPSLAILILDKKSLNYNLIFNVVYFLVFFVLLLNVIDGIEYDHQGRSSGFLSMYSINFGHVGVLLAIMSFYQLIFKTEKFDYYVCFMIFGFFLGTYILYASATRGPLVAYILAIAIALLSSKKFKIFMVFVGLMLLGLVAIIYLKLGDSIQGENKFIERVSKMLLSGDSSGRGKIYKDSFIVFLENPIFGGRFVFPDGVYAHNIFLDILMSMGILGMIIFVLFFRKCIVEILSMFKKRYVFEKEYIWLHLLYVQYLVFAFFSCSMFDTPEFWYLTAMILVISKNKEANV